MSGLYLHIPFCKKACHYCNFHFSTSFGLKDALIEALLLEMALRQAYLPDNKLASVYFGGGTPSVLTTAELMRIFDKIHELFTLAPGAEITLEANPDDLSPAKLRELKQYTPVNRLSIGIQSFEEADLRWMNRAHSAGEALACIGDAQAAGFDNLTIDLIYGSPTTSDAQWQQNVQTAVELGIPHLSCYCLTVEEGTALHHFVQKGKALPVDEEKAARQFEWLVDYTGRHGFLHYEISNFARPDRLAQHNSSYWRGAPYLGIGPSAHSFDGHSRQWNVANNARYIRALETGETFFEKEILRPAQRYNEYILTGLRTIWGCEQAVIRKLGEDFWRHFEASVQPYLAAGSIEMQEGVYRLSGPGKLLADRISADLFFDDSPE